MFGGIFVNFILTTNQILHNVGGKLLTYHDYDLSRHYFFYIVFGMTLYSEFPQ